MKIDLLIAISCLRLMNLISKRSRRSIKNLPQLVLSLGVIAGAAGSAAPSSLNASNSISILNGATQSKKIKNGIGNNLWNHRIYSISIFDVSQQSDRFVLTTDRYICFHHFRWINVKYPSTESVLSRCGIRSLTACGRCTYQESWVKDFENRS